jgi:hypothetical protein|tara:strand:+ start:5617 stop:5829 length:213 start_codon:yes stop_codon:yes gene_type:complete
MENEDLIQVEGETNLFRDKKTGAILNTDSTGYAQYMRMKQRRQTEREELDTIKSDIEEIKLLLRQLTNGS